MGVGISVAAHIGWVVKERRDVGQSVQLEARGK